MKVDRVQYFRLIIPLIAIVFGKISNIDLMIGFGLGYFFCWVFGLLYAESGKDDLLSMENGK